MVYRGEIRRAWRRRVLPCVESLCARVLLSSSYTIPKTGVSSVYLTAGAIAGDIDVRLDSLGAAPVATLTPRATDQSESVSGGPVGVTVVDKVAAAAKPSGGLFVTGPGAGIFKL